MGLLPVSCQFWTLYTPLIARAEYFNIHVDVKILSRKSTERLPPVCFCVCLLAFVIALPCVKNVKDLRMRKEDFETLRVIGKGAFGQVSDGGGRSYLYWCVLQAQSVMHELHFFTPRS